jgi:hypothetical protein
VNISDLGSMPQVAPVAEAGMGTQRVEIHAAADVETTPRGRRDQVVAVGGGPRSRVERLDPASTLRSGAPALGEASVLDRARGLGLRFAAPRATSERSA